MHSYAVMGAARGIGFGYAQALTATASNTVFAIIPSRFKDQSIFALASERSNLHIIFGDTTFSYDMERAASEVSTTTGGKLDVLINNAATAPPEHFMKIAADFQQDPEGLKKMLDDSMETSFYAALYATNAFIPLILAGDQKKIICISTGMVDIAVNLSTELPFGMGYGAAKAALNLMIANYANHYKPQGVKFLPVSPGWVHTRAASGGDDNEADKGSTAFAVLYWHKIDASVTGKISVEESVKAQLEVIDALTLEKSGRFVTHRRDQPESWF